MVLTRFVSLSFGPGYQRSEVSAGYLVLWVSFAPFFFPSFFSCLPKPRSLVARDAGWAGVSPHPGWALSQRCLCPESSCLPYFPWKTSNKIQYINNREVFYFWRVGGGFQRALTWNPGGTKSNPELQAQSPAWKILPQLSRENVGVVVSV